MKSAGAFAAALLAFACGGNSTPAEPGAPISFETILQRSIPGQAGGQLREVARDAAAWSALWAQLREGPGGFTLPAEPPAVDFTREMVIVAAMETQGCVSRVTIRSIERRGGTLVVDLLEAPPAPNCICVTSERPIHVVRLSRDAAPVRFVAERGQTSC